MGHPVMWIVLGGVDGSGWIMEGWGGVEQLDLFIC